MKDLENKNIDEHLDKCVEKISSLKERNYIKDMLKGLLVNNILDPALLDSIPDTPREVGKTRFDQIYDAAMSLVFPGYREETLKRLLGADFEIRSNLKIWRCVFPEKFGITHVLIRANSFQESFALACDYACRMSLRMYQKIPADLTIRVMFASEKSIRRMLDMRWANRVKRRKELQLEGRKFTSKELTGARLVALGHNKQSEYSIFRYAEARDLKKILKYKDKIRISSVETETFRDELPDELRFPDA